MSSREVNKLHFVLMPLMTPGHLIPMTDMAKLLAQHGALATIVTTPLNAARFASTIHRASSSGLPVRLLTLPFPTAGGGLPDGCESMDRLPSRSSIASFFAASSLLQQPFEALLSSLDPTPSCLICGKNLAWTVETSRRFKIPRVFFDGMGCFASACTLRLELSHVSSSPTFVVPGIPHRIELAKTQLPESLNPGSSTDLAAVRNRMRAAEAEADAVLVNSFEELEPDYVEDYRLQKRNPNIWCVGPVASANRSELDRMERGDETEAPVEVKKGWMEWLDSWEDNSVIYACLGSICGLKAWQLKELGLGLEASKRPFVWVVRSKGIKEWIEEEGFEERSKSRGLVIRGWAPQVSILCHRAVGAFLTHCGWNSTLEGISAGVPLITCPLFAEQFLNESLAVDVVGIGVRVGVECAVTWGLEHKAGLVISREGVENAIHKVFDRGEEGQERRRKARELAHMANTAVQQGGSSFLNMDLFIRYVSQQIIHI